MRHISCKIVIKSNRNQIERRVVLVKTISHGQSYQRQRNVAENVCYAKLSVLVMSLATNGLPINGIFFKKCHSPAWPRFRYFAKRTVPCTPGTLSIILACPREKYRARIQTILTILFLRLFRFLKLYCESLYVNCLPHSLQLTFIWTDRH